MTVAQMCIWYYNSGTWRVAAGFDVLAGNFLREKQLLVRLEQWLDIKKEETDHGTGDKRYADWSASSVRS